MSYQDVRLPIKYSGRKNEGLGNVIYNLLELSKADTFVDMFGGAGYASMAASQVEDVSNIYINDIDPVCRNFYEVMIDDNLFAEFKEAYTRVYAKINDEATAKMYMENAIKEMKLVLSEGIQDKVDTALLFTYYHSYKVQGGKSEVGAANESALKRNKTSYSESSFDIVHNLLKQAKICNSDILGSQDIFDWLLNSTNSVFYSDSPYLFTEGYNVGDLTPADMKKLINIMFIASVLDKKFVFSCRCGMTIQSSTYTKWGGVVDQSFLKPEEVEAIKNELNDPKHFFKDYHSFENYKAESVIKSLLKKIYANQVVFDSIIDRFAELSNCNVIAVMEVAIRDRDIEPVELMKQYLCSFKKMELFYTNIDLNGLALPDYDYKKVEKSAKGSPKYCKYVIMSAKEFRDIADKCMLKFPDADKKKVISSKTQYGCYVE